MPLLFTTLLFTLMTDTLLLLDFNNPATPIPARVVDDVVMGGRSQGRFERGAEGQGVFYGAVSTENNGGFSSVRFPLPKKDIAGYTTAVLTVRGDGKRYQFRVKSNRNDRHAYIWYFDTSGAWETIRIPLQAMTPSFRGMKLNLPDYDAQVLEEIALLIGNQKAEAFKLEIKQIALQ